MCFDTGIILEYRLVMRGNADANGVYNPLQKIIHKTDGYHNPRSSSDHPTLPKPDSNFTVDNLKPFTEYHFMVSSWNSIGSIESPWIVGRTLEGSMY